MFLSPLFMYLSTYLFISPNSGLKDRWITCLLHTVCSLAQSSVDVAHTRLLPQMDLGTWKPSVVQQHYETETKTFAYAV